MVGEGPLRQNDETVLDVKQKFSLKTYTYTSRLCFSKSNAAHVIECGH